MVGRREREATITYQDIARLCDVSLNAVHQAATPAKNGKSRQLLDLDNLETIVLWLAAHGAADLRRRMCAYAAQGLLDDGSLSTRQLAAAPKKPRSIAK